MIARLKGIPFTRDEGDMRISLEKLPRSLNVFVNKAMRIHPMTLVLRQVRPNNATFTQGNFCSGVSSNSISADGLNELSMKRVLLSVGPVPPRLQRLQVLAWLEAYSFSWRDIYFRTRTRVPPDTGLPRLYGKYSEAAQLDPIIGLEGILHAIEDGIHCLFRFRLAHSRPLNDLIHKIEFDHWNLRFGLKPATTMFCTYF